MSEKLKKHLNYYLSLLIILVLGVFLVFQASYSKSLQMLMVMIIGFFYVGWGILHHYLHHDLKSKIVIEYVLMGTLGITIILFFLKGGF